MMDENMDKQRIAFVFPGQGAQKVGMGKDLYESSARARELFDFADDLLSLPLSATILEGPQASLNLTAHAQPAILLISFVLTEMLEIRPIAYAGHSLGEYSALTAAGCLSLDAALKLVHSRGVFMQQAVPPGEGAMAAVIGANHTELQLVIDKVGRGEVVVENYNCPGQTVISGRTGAVQAVVDALKPVRCIMLPVSAPFHSPYMQDAQDNLRPLLQTTNFLDPRAPVWCNADASAVTSAAAAREKLLIQTTHPVLWEQSVRSMISELKITVFVEIGPGATLTNFLKRIDPSVRGITVNGPADIEQAQQQLTS